MSWRADAACRPVDDDHPNTKLFFEGRMSTIKAALEVCDKCSVTDECLEAVMIYEATQPYRYGIAGKMNAEERKRLAKQEAEVAGEDHVQDVDGRVPEILDGDDGPSEGGEVRLERIR